MEATTTAAAQAAAPRRTARFDTTEFRFAHGREPRGRGFWAFIPFRGGDVVWAPNGLTFAEARKWVAQTHPEVGFWKVGS